MVVTQCQQSNLLAKDFILCLLQADPAYRPTAKVEPFAASLTIGRIATRLAHRENSQYHHRSLTRYQRRMYTLPQVLANFSQRTSKTQTCYRSWCTPFWFLLLTSVRLANRLKALTMTQYSSDEDNETGDTDKTERPPSSHSSEKKPFSGTTAFAEVVRASMKLKETGTPTTKSWDLELRLAVIRRDSQIMFGDKDGIRYFY